MLSDLLSLLKTIIFFLLDFLFSILRLKFFKIEKFENSKKTLKYIYLFYKIFYNWSHKSSITSFREHLLYPISTKIHLKHSLSHCCRGLKTENPSIVRREFSASSNFWISTKRNLCAIPEVWVKPLENIDVLYSTFSRSYSLFSTFFLLQVTYEKCIRDFFFELGKQQPKHISLVRRHKLERQTCWYENFNWSKQSVGKGDERERGEKKTERQRKSGVDARWEG